LCTHFKTYTEFRKRDESLCADDGAQRDAKFSELLPSAVIYCPITKQIISV